MDSTEATLFEIAPEAMRLVASLEAMRFETTPLAFLETARWRASRELTRGRRRSGRETPRGRIRGWGS